MAGNSNLTIRSSGQDKDTPEQARIAYVFLVAFVAAFGGFLFGYDLMIMSGAQLFLKEHFHLSAEMYGFSNSSAMLGCMAGPFLGAWLCDWLGRKGTLFVAAFLFAASVMGTALPKDIVTFNIFRILGGVGVGLASIASPMYLAEIAPARSRGRLGLMYQFAIVVGALMAVGLAWILADSVAEKPSWPLPVFLGSYLSNETVWRWMFAAEIVPIIFFVGALIFVPRSPRWLATKKHHSSALEILRKINGPQQAQVELKEIEESLIQESSGFSEIFQPGHRRALVVGSCLGLFNFLTGAAAFGFYLPTLFKQGGFEENSAAIFQSVIVNAQSVPLIILAIWLVDRVGRRPLWLVTSFAMVFAQLIMAYAFHYQLTGGWIVLIILLCMWPHQLGLGPLPWLMMSEIHPTRTRAKAVAISTTVLWAAAFLVPATFPPLAELSKEMIGSIAGVFVMYSGICVFAFIFGILWLPETKHKTLEEIASFWKKGSETE